jgi:hypothetical protein
MGLSVLVNAGWYYVNFMQQFPPRPTAEALVRRRF